jgi:uncharacterized protein
MKLISTVEAGTHAVTAYGAGYVAVNGRRLEQSFILTSTQLFEEWKVRSIDDIGKLGLDELATLNCDIVILGTGTAQHFPAPKLLQPLLARRIGVEVMDNFAACRTYNILLAEGRAVALAVIMESVA